MLNLPMIDYACSLFEEDALQDCYIIGAQHLLPSTLTLFLSLFNKGLKPENVSLLGKCYSTDHDTYYQMKKHNLDVSEMSIDFDSHEDFDIAFKKNIKAFLSRRKNRLNSKQYKKIIVLDDGGELIEELKGYIDDFSIVVAMEQTSAGYRRLKNQNLDFPVINMARSKAKLEVETKRVIENAINKINYHTQNKKINRVLILGQGPIGEKLYDNLKQNYEVFRYDKNPKKSDLTAISLDHYLNEFDLIVGCTGSTSLNKNQHKLLKKGSILVSLSSTDREFDAIYLRKKAEATNNPWKHIEVDGILLLNGGFPISFDNIDADDSYFFQFTRSLIMSSIYQALNHTGKNGLIDLDYQLQGMMIQRFEEYRQNVNVRSL